MTAFLQRVADMSASIDWIAHMVELYERYAVDLRRVREEQIQQQLHTPAAKRQLDDVEAELTYLRLRERRPDTVVELGCLHGWSTSWILRALRDNGTGVLHSYDRISAAKQVVPAHLHGQWRFIEGDITHRRIVFPKQIDYLFVDAAHTAGFARWYLTHLLPQLSGALVSVHDVFHRRRPIYVREPGVVLRWLQHSGIKYHTASRLRCPEAYRQFQHARRELGFTAPIHTGTRNPMIFFAVPDPLRGKPHTTN